MVITKTLVEQIFDLILKFADYGFPRAHAVSYSKITYIMSFLKVHYPNYFYANILSNVIGSEKQNCSNDRKQKNKVSLYCHQTLTKVIGFINLPRRRFFINWYN